MVNVTGGVICSVVKSTMQNNSETEQFFLSALFD